MPDSRSKYRRFIDIAIEWAGETGLPPVMLIGRLCEWAVAGAFPEGAFVTPTGEKISPVELFSAFRVTVGNGNAAIGDYIVHMQIHVAKDVVESALLKGSDVLSFCEHTNTRPPSFLLGKFERLLRRRVPGEHPAPPECPDGDEHAARQSAYGAAQGGLNNLRATIARLKGKPKRSGGSAPRSESVSVEYWGPKWVHQRDRVQKDIHASGNKELQQDLDALDAEWAELLAEASHTAASSENAGSSMGTVSDDARHQQPIPPEVAQPGTDTPVVRLVIVPARSTILFDGREIQLSPRLFKLMHLLASAAVTDGRIVSQTEIETCLWPSKGSAPKNGAADAIRALRKRLDQHLPRAIDSTDLIETRLGQGYILAPIASPIQICS